MVKKISIGILGIQGAVSEHLFILKNVLKINRFDGNVIIVNDKKDIEIVDALIIPGGESSTILKVLYELDLYENLNKRIKENDLPIMGTCAGCIILAKDIVNNIGDMKLLKIMDFQIERNAFGRQKESFEKYINIKNFDTPFKGVFIRAPIIRKVWGDCKILAKIENKIVIVKQGKNMALSFHPELTNDNRIHKFFLDLV